MLFFHNYPVREGRSEVKKQSKTKHILQADSNIDSWPAIQKLVYVREK